MWENTFRVQFVVLFFSSHEACLFYDWKCFSGECLDCGSFYVKDSTRCVHD